MIAVYCKLGDKTYNITHLCESVEISGDLTSVCRQASITFAYAVYTKNFPAIIIPDYTPVWIRDENADGSLKEGLISGISVDFSKTHDKYTLTVFDFAYYLKQSDITKKFNNESADQGAKEILDELGVTASYLYPSNIAINKLIAQQNAYDTIMGLYTEVKKQTGELFYLSANYNNEVGVYKLNQHMCNVLIQPCTGDVNVADGNLISIDYKETGSNLVTRVKVYNQSNELIDTIDNEDYNISSYGIIQKNYVQEDDKDYKTVVKESQLHGIDKDITVEILGDYTFWTGSAVKIYVPWIKDLDKNDDGSYKTAYITSDAHTWDCATGSYVTKLDLTLNEKMDEKELQDASEIKKSTKKGNGVVASGNEVTDYAQQFLGLKYVWGGTSLETGADCSGFIQAVYNHFGISIGRTTYDQMNDGIAISTADQSQWRPGDLIFPHSGHVVMYLGNGKVIHEPKTGDVCKISDVYFGTPCAVRRVM